MAKKKQRRRTPLSKKFIPQASIVSDELYIPNHSGIAAHPEAKSTFLKLDCSNVPLTDDLTIDKGEGISPKLIIKGGTLTNYQEASIQVTTTAGALTIEGWRGVDFVTKRVSSASSVNFFQGLKTNRTGDVEFNVYGSGTASDARVQMLHTGTDASFKNEKGDFTIRTENDKEIIFQNHRDAAGMVLDGNQRLGIGTLTPATSAKVDITSTTGALLLPRMDTIQRDALTAVNGMLIYNTTTNVLEAYENGSWVNI